MSLVKFRELKDLKQLSSFLRSDYETMRSFLNTPIKILEEERETVISADHDKTISRDVSFHDAIMLEDPGRRFFVQRIKIPKKSNPCKHRIVYRILNGEFQNINKVITFHLNRIYKPGSCVSGFVKNRGIVYNAKLHLNKKVVLNLDIKDFFESITESMVISLFSEIGCMPEVSRALARLVTLNGVLVQGFNSSPVIANMIAIKIDKDLLKLATSSGSVYSRYADDICFSSNNKLPDIITIKKILNKHGFKINSEKTRKMYKGYKQYVTGLTVSDNKMPRIPRRFKRRIRLQLYFMEKFGVIQHVINSKGLSNDAYKDDEKMKIISDEADNLIINVRGWIDYINSVEPSLADNFYIKLKNIKNNI